MCRARRAFGHTNHKNLGALQSTFLYSLYVYAPNKVAPAIFAVLFGISAAGHIWQCIHYIAWRMIGLQPLCAVFYTVGYALREYGAFNYLYSPSNLYCHPLLELANYHVLGRVLYCVPYCAPFPPHRIMSLFGALVIVVEALNGLGVAFTSNPSSPPSTQKLGGQLTKASTAFQLAVITVCFLLASLFYRKCVNSNIHSRNVKTPLAVLCLSMFLILVRCIYRFIEHVGNVRLAIEDLRSMKRLTPLLRYERNFWHPGRLGIDVWDFVSSEDDGETAEFCA
ncbi:putative RTA1 domain protein, partial [Aureobasidium melanogenum]